MPPKRGAKATPAAVPAVAAAKVAAAPDRAAELLKDCDKALHGVRSALTKKSLKVVADLLEKQPCSLTYRTQSAAYLISALVEPASAAKSLTAACAASAKGVSAEPSCLHLEVMDAVTHYRRAYTLTFMLFKELAKDPSDPKEVARLSEEGEAAIDEMSTLMAKLDKADFSNAALEVLEQEKRMLPKHPDSLSAQEYRQELKGVAERLRKEVTRCQMLKIHALVGCRKDIAISEEVSKQFHEQLKMFPNEFASWTRILLGNEVDPLRKFVAQTQVQKDRASVHAAAALSTEASPEPAAAQLAAASSRGISSAQRAPEPTPKPDSGRRRDVRGRGGALATGTGKGTATSSRSAVASAIPRDVLPLMESVVRLFRSLVEAGGSDAVLKLLKLPVAELDVIAEDWPLSMRTAMQDALQELESSGSAVSWEFGGFQTKTYAQLWDELHSVNCPRPSELPLWTDAALFIGDTSLTEFIAPLAASAEPSGSADETVWSAQERQRASAAWQQLWVGDDSDLDSAGKVRVAASSRRDFSRLMEDDSDDLWQTPSRRVLDTRLQLLSGPTARRDKLVSLLNSKRLDDAAALVLSPPPASATHTCGGHCLLEIRSSERDNRIDLDGYDSFSDDESADVLEIGDLTKNRCFPVHQRLEGYSRVDSLQPPVLVLHDTKEGLLRVTKQDDVLQRMRFYNLPLSDSDASLVPSPESFYARFPTYSLILPAQPTLAKASPEVQKLTANIRFLSANVLYATPFTWALFERLDEEREKLLRSIAVADTLRGLRELCESRLLPTRCVRELKRHLLRCGVDACETQSLQESLNQLDTVNLVAAARYVYRRYFRRASFLQKSRDSFSASLEQELKSPLFFVPSGDAAPVLSVSAAQLELFVREGKLDVDALGRAIFDDSAPLGLALEPDEEASLLIDEAREREYCELLSAASNKLQKLRDLNGFLVARTRALLAAKRDYDALDQDSVRSDSELRVFVLSALRLRKESLELSRRALSVNHETLAMKGPGRDKKNVARMFVDSVLRRFQEVEQKSGLDLHACFSILDDNKFSELTTRVLLQHAQRQVDLLEEESFGNLALAHAQAAMEMLEYEFSEAHEQFTMLCLDCCDMGVRDERLTLVLPFLKQLRTHLVAEAVQHAGSVQDTLMADEISRVSADEAAKQKNAAKNAAKRDKKEAERRKREEAAALAAAEDAQRAAQEHEAAEAARAAEAAEREAQQSRVEAERAAALEQRAQQMEAAKKEEVAEKARLRDQQAKERSARLQAQEEAEHARAIALSAAEFQASAPPSAPPPPARQQPREYRPQMSSGSASILPAFAGMDLRRADEQPAPSALPSSLFDWPPQSQSIFSVLPPPSILPPPLLGSAAPSSLQPVVTDVSGLSNAAGEYNCFLNSLVQALFRLRPFRAHLLICVVPDSSPPHRDISRDIAVVRALQNLFIALDRGARLLRDPLAVGAESESVAPTALRLALAALVPGGEAGVNVMADAAEVLSSMYDCFLRVSSAYREATVLSPVQKMFGLHMSELVYCEGCRLTTHRLSYNTFFHLVHATALRNAAQQCPPSAPLEQRLAFLLDEERKSCDTDFRGCGKQTQITHTLGNIPDVFTISIGWDSSTASEAEVGATMKALSPSICPQLVYRGTQPSPDRDMFELRALVVYYGSHYLSFVRTGETFQSGDWTRIDDASVTRVGDWNALCDACARGHLQPTVLFYEKNAPPALP